MTAMDWPRAGSRIRVISGKWRGRVGVVRRVASTEFRDWCYVDLDLAPRERVQKTHEFMRIDHLEPEHDR